MSLSDTVCLSDDDEAHTVTCETTKSDTDADRACIAEDALEATERLKLARLCPFPGVDMEHQQSKTGATDLHLNLKFKKLSGKADAAKVAQGRDVVALGDDGALELKMGDEFGANGMVHCVASMSKAEGSVCCAESGFEESGPFRTFYVEEATEKMNILVEIQ